MLKDKNVLNSKRKSPICLVIEAWHIWQASRLIISCPYIHKSDPSADKYKYQKTSRFEIYKIKSALIQKGKLT